MAGKTILLRADIDALELPDATGTAYASKNPGLNHACGHDGHAAALLESTKVLKNIRIPFQERLNWPFSPLKKLCGARQFVEGNYLEAIDQVFGIHLDSSVPVGKLVATKGATNASCDILKLKSVVKVVTSPNHRMAGMLF